MRPLHRVRGVEQVGLTRAGAAAAHIDGRDGTARGGAHHGAAGGPAGALGGAVGRGGRRIRVEAVRVPHADAGDVGEGVGAARRTRGHHGIIATTRLSCTHVTQW